MVTPLLAAAGGMPQAAVLGTALLAMLPSCAVRPVLCCPYFDPTLRHSTAVDALSCCAHPRQECGQLRNQLIDPHQAA